MLYLGKRFDGRYQLFRSRLKPTEETHGKDYKLVIGPFKSKLDATNHAGQLGYVPSTNG
jgi:hypothetical protein